MNRCPDSCHDFDVIYEGNPDPDSDIPRTLYVICRFCGLYSTTYLELTPIPEAFRE